jgi:hypothetical protein
VVKDTGMSVWRPKFDSGPVCVGIMVDIMILGLVFLYFSFPRHHTLIFHSSILDAVESYQLTVLLNKTFKNTLHKMEVSGQLYIFAVYVH